LFKIVGRVTGAYSPLRSKTSLTIRAKGTARGKRHLTVSLEILVKVGVKSEDYLRKIEGTPKASAWKSKLSSYSPSAEAVRGLSKIKRKFNIITFSAHWCKDCLQNIPALVKSLNEAKNSNIRLAMIDIDSNKQIAQEADVRAIPTIIVYNSSGSEVARIIENPSKGFGTVEDELLSILTTHN
jgi:thiol-disulfide isomerase/thioredoxin